MKKFLLLSLILFTRNAHANDFHPYVGANVGLNLADYITPTDIDDTYYAANINIGARIGRNFGVELFFGHSSTNSIDLVYGYDAFSNDIYYLSYGFDIFGYYSVSNDFDFFTSFGVANTKTYIETTYISPTYQYTSKTPDSNVNTRIGLGLMYTFPTDNISILAQYKYIPINNELFGTISEFSAGIRMNF